MKILKTKFAGTYKIIHNKKLDNRGYFERVFCKKSLKKNNIKFDIKQANFSFNKYKGTLRGFHFQKKPFSESKIIRCLKGKVCVVLLNINKQSKYFLKSIKFILKEDDHLSILISKNCATAFMTLKDNTLLMYYMSEYYKKNYGVGINYKDPKINVKWPLSPKVISKKDKKIAYLK